jgi:hypothetical protein
MLLSFFNFLRGTSTFQALTSVLSAQCPGIIRCRWISSRQCLWGLLATSTNALLSTALVILSVSLGSMLGVGARR